MNDATAPAVAITGASSFTALWIARALHADGWRVHALCHRAADEHSGLHALRVRLLRTCSEVHFGLRAENGDLARWVLRERPLLWIHHHHWMEAFRSPAYDVARARAVGLVPLGDLVAALARQQAAGILYSGSFFEPGEGDDAAAAPATPYARSKREVWDALTRHAGEAGLPLSKVVIPNPVGPLENDDRLVPSLIRSSLNRTPFVLGAPDAISDYLPVSVLASIYVAVARALLAGRSQIRRPSGRVATTGEWGRTVCRELIGDALGLEPCTLTEARPSAATCFRNPDREREPIDWKSVWSDYAAWITRLGLLDHWRRC